MALLLLEPAEKEYIWGGNRLRERFGKKMEGDKLAETWELSCHADGLSTIKLGEYSGMTLRDYLAENPTASGTKCRGFSDFPLMI